MIESVTLLTAALAVGCVSTGKYETLRKELDQANAAHSRQEGECEGRLKAREGELADARARCDQKDDEIRRLEAARGAIEGQLAAALADRKALSASADEMRRALDETNRRKAEAERRMVEFRQLLGKLRAMIDAGKLKVRMVDGRMVLALPSDVLFPSGSAQLSPEGAQTISEVASVLIAIPERKLQVEGHTDNVPIHTARFPSNWELGAARAITIVNGMVQAGMAPSRISAASFGESRPVAGNDSDVGRAANRRVEIVLVPDLAMLPGFDELRKAVESP